MSTRSTVAAVALALLLAGVPAAEAASAGAALLPAPETKLRYSVSLAGIPVAKADMTVAGDAERYASRLIWRTSGLVDVFAGARGDASASGRFGPRRPMPTTYTLASGDGRKAVKVVLAMVGGSVKAAEAEPPTRVTPDLVPLQPQHRLDVLDPLSAVLAGGRVEAADGSGLCRRTLPIFDGWTRYDIRLSPKSTLPTKRPGIIGPIVVCAARYVPVAGHRAEHKVTKFMTDNEDLSVAFARLEKADVWVPYKVSVRTLIGTAEVELDGFTAAGYETAAAPKP